MGGLIGLAVFVLDIIAIVDIFKKTWSGGKKALWIILVLILPFIGMAVYFLVGRKSA